MKRKAEDGAGANVAKKKRKPEALQNGGELDESMLVNWLKLTPNATTQDCIAHFRPYLTTSEKKQHFTTMVKAIAQLKNGVLVLRNSYRDSVGAPSPRAASPDA